MRIFVLVIITFVLGFVGCSTEQKKNAPFTQPISSNCDDFIQTIRVCAEKGHHQKLKGILSRVARCETGNKCTGNIDSPSGEYHGPFQFLRATWELQCHPIFDRLHIDGCNSAKSIYDTCCATICAADMIASGGLHNWPTCGKKPRLPANE